MGRGGEGDRETGRQIGRQTDRQNFETTSAPTMLMPPLQRLQDMLPLRLLASVPHKLYILIADRPRGSCQGFWQATCPARVCIVAGNEGIAASDDAGSRPIVGCHCKPLNSCVVSLKMLLDVTRNKVTSCRQLC